MRRFLRGLIIMCLLAFATSCIVVNVDKGPSKCEKSECKKKKETKKEECKKEESKKQEPKKEEK